MLVHKISTRELWEQTQRTGVFPLMPADMKDGYIHLSREEPTSGTIRKYFLGARDLVLLAVDTTLIGEGCGGKNLRPVASGWAISRISMANYYFPTLWKQRYLTRPNNSYPGLVLPASC